MLATMVYLDEKEVYIKFGKHLKALRKEHNLSQSALGGKAELEKSLIQRIERGSNLTLKTMTQIANGFGITLSELLDFENEETDKTEQD